MKVWFPTIKTGTGTDVFTERLAGGLRKKDIDASITWFNHYYEIIPQLMKLSKKPDGVDIIHTNSRLGFPFKDIDSKLVITIHSSNFDDNCDKYKSSLQSFYHNNFVLGYEEKSIVVSDAVVAVSNHVAKITKKLFKTSKPIVIHNGIDEKYFKPTHKEEDSNILKLLFVGNAKKLKGIDLLQPIMERLGSNYLLKHTGVKSIKDTNNIINIGNLDMKNILIEYDECDALLFPSRNEGFGYVACEAMACGKPVIAGNNSGIREIVKHNETGILCETDNIEAFCNAARFLSKNYQVRKKMGIAARKRVLNNFTLTTMIDKYIKLYEAVLEV